MKHQINIVKLRFKTPLHLSKGKADSYEESEELLHSDTLKSALFAAALQLYGNDLDKQAFFNSFRVSSAFPFYGQEYFFPKPLHPLRFQYADEKKLKKVKWLGKTIFEKALNNVALQVEPKHFALGEMALSESGTTHKLYMREKTQRVKIPKMWEPDNAVSIPFYLDKIYFSTQGGLFFILLHDGNSSQFKQLEAALRLLGDNGIGLQRGLGNGQYDYEWTTLELEVPENAEAGLSLSLYCPTWEEWLPLDLENSAYDFVKRGGWISAAEPEYLNFRKRSIHMLPEGSVLPFKIKDGIALKGNGFIDLTPQTVEPPLPEDMKIWRDGTGVFVPAIL